jgi:hypothetical protein
VPAAEDDTMKIKMMLVGMTLLLVMGTQAAWAECFIGGTITADDNPDPLGPAFRYTMVITWDTGNAYSLSHADLIMDINAGTCLCEDFLMVLSWDDPIGFSDGNPGDCTVDYQGFLECGGDPSIPDLEDIILKFEPIESEECEPGPTGTGTFVFYSSRPPWPINEEILTVVDKYSLQYCYGHLSGEFPTMDCDPVGGEKSGWGELKGMYR